MPRPAERQAPRADLRSTTAPRAGSARRAFAPRSPASAVLQLQRQIGNAAVVRLIARSPETAADAPVTNTGMTGAQDWFDRAYAHYQAGRYEQARKAFAEAYKLAPIPNFLYNEAACLQMLGRNHEAADSYSRYLAAAPDAKDAASTKERIEKLRSGPAVGPPLPARKPADSPGDDPPVTNTGMTGAQDWFDRGYAHWKAGRYEKARNAFGEAYKLAPIPNFLYNEAACLEMLGRKAEAADTYARYLTANPAADDADKVRERIEKLRAAAGADAPITEKGRAGAQAWFDRGQEAYLAKDFAKALDAFKRAFALEPLPAFVFNQASVLEKLGRYAAAANALEHYLVLGASDAKQVMERIKQLREEAAKEKLVDPWADEERAPDVTATGKQGASQWYDRASVAYHLGDFQRAYDAFVRAHDLNPTAEMVYNQAAALHRLGNTIGAIEAYQRYLALAPKATDAEKVRKAIAKLRTAAAKDDLIDPSEEDDPALSVTVKGNQGASLWFDRGQAAYARGAFKRAYDAFVRAYELAPFPEFVYNQGAALHRLGNAAAAVQAYERYLAAAPEAGDAEKVRKMIKKLRGGR